MRRLLYRLYYLLSSLEYWIRRRFTLGGLLVLSGIVLSASLGLDTNQAVAYQAFTFLTCLLLAALVCSRRRPGRLGWMEPRPRSRGVLVKLDHVLIACLLGGAFLLGRAGHQLTGLFVLSMAGLLIVLDVAGAKRQHGWEASEADKEEPL